MRLVGKKIIAEVAQVERIDVGRVEPLVDAREHLSIGFDEQILGVQLSKHAEPGHPSAHQRDTSPQFASSNHQTGSRVWSRAATVRGQDFLYLAPDSRQAVRAAAANIDLAPARPLSGRRPIPEARQGCPTGWLVDRSAVPARSPAVVGSPEPTNFSPVPRRDHREPPHR